MFHVEKYRPPDAKPASCVDFIWRLASDDDVEVNHMLPTLNTDLIINLAGPIAYSIPDGLFIAAPKAHIRLLKTQAQMIRQNGVLNVWGIAFYAYGLYPFLQTPLNELKDPVLELTVQNAGPVIDAVEGLKNIRDTEDGFAVLEAALGRWLPHDTDFDSLATLQRFLAQMRQVQISAFCREHKPGIKTLERLAKKYTGLTPKQLQQIGRFQIAGNRLAYGQPLTSLTDLAYDHDYYDQTHFIKEFKAFTNATPSNFIKAANTVKSKLK